MVGHAIEPRADRAGDVGREAEVDARRLRLGALGVARAVEKKLGRAVGLHHGDAVAFEDAEVGDVAQIIALPGIAVDHQLVDAGLRHGGEQTSAPLLRQHESPRAVLLRAGS